MSIPNDDETRENLWRALMSTSKNFLESSTEAGNVRGFTFLLLGFACLVL